MTLGRYYGSKQRFANEMVRFILKYTKDHNLVFDQIIDCFCGTGSVSAQFRKHVTVPIYASDHLECMIILLQSIQNGFVPPETITEPEFNAIRLEPTNPLHALLNISCSFQGQYLRDNFHTWTLESLKRLHKNIPKLNYQNIQFVCCDYKDWSDKIGCLIICDPPYLTACKAQWPKNYKGFEHEEFYQWVRAMSQDNIVIVCEFTMPNDFECIWTKPLKTSNRHGQMIQRFEKLFILKSVCL